MKYSHRVEEVGSTLAALERLGDKEEKWNQRCVHFQFYKTLTYIIWVSSSFGRALVCLLSVQLFQFRCFLNYVRAMKRHCEPPETLTDNKEWQHTHLGDKIVMVGQMGAAVHTAVATVAGVQVSLEGLGLCQLHHVCEEEAGWQSAVVHGLVTQAMRPAG